MVIHVGVAGTRKSIDLEMKSTNGPYDKLDVRGKVRDPLYVDGPGKKLTVLIEHVLFHFSRTDHMHRHASTFDPLSG